MKSVANELIAVAAFDVVNQRWDGEYRGKIDPLFSSLQDSWPGSYSRGEFIESLINASRTEAVYILSDEEISKDFVKISAKGLSRYFELHLRDSAARQHPLLFRYAQFGAGWLRETWEKSADSPTRALPSFVEVNDDLGVATEVSVILDELIDGLENGNEAGAIFADDRHAVADEVKSLRRMFDQSKVRVQVLLTHARETLRYIADKAGAAVIGDLAKRALKLILECLS